MNSDLASFGREVRRVADQTAHWTPARWRVRVDATETGSRADAMHALVQELADLAAAYEDRPRIAVPRLPHDTALVDQLRVVAGDLCGCEPTPSTLATARDAVSRARTALF